MSFNNVEQVYVAGPAINKVARDQFNVTAGVVHISSRADYESTEYDEFKRVTTGDMYLLKEIHRLDRWWTQRTIYSVESPEQKMRCTAIRYNGPYAQEFWQEDFRRFSQNRSPDAWQLYGLNHSSVPFLIFHDELVPLGHFYKKSFWGDFFVRLLEEKLDCYEEEIWLNTRGTLIKGPKGAPFLPLGHNEIPIPSSAEMLKDDVSFQFFQKFPSTMLDYLIVERAGWQCTSSDNIKCFFCEELQNTLPESTPGIPDDLRFDTVYSPSLGAVARWRDSGALWEMNMPEGSMDKTSTEVYACFNIAIDKFQESWLSQSSRIIDACGMWGTEEQCFVVSSPMKLILESIPRRYLNQPKLSPFVNPPSIYLFIYPLPMTMSGIKSWGENRTHFWSLDENGRSEMTEEECRRWRVPELETCVYHGPAVYTWPRRIYTAIRDWQVARGFDPATADFAQSLGLPEFDILIDNATAGSRFEEVHENSSSGSSTPETWSGQSSPETFDTPLPAEVAIPQPSHITVPPRHSKIKARPRAETPPQVQPMVEDSDPVSILGKRQRDGQIQTRSIRQRV